MSYYIYTHPPFDLSHKPAVETLHNMISTFQNTAKSKGQSVALFEEPDIDPYADKEVI